MATCQPAPEFATMLSASDLKKAFSLPQRLGEIPSKSPGDKPS
jgi:hypothetical protein